MKAPSPDQVSDDEFRMKALYYGIGRLKPVEKAVILLYLEENSYDEIAQIIGISKNNVSVKIVRIKKKLEKILARLLQ